MVKIRIFGKGYLGNRLAEAYNCPVVSRRDLDLTSLSDVRSYVRVCKPEIIINAAGKTGGKGEIGIDGCETNKPETIASNIVAALNLSIAACEKGVYFVHLGSGCIYAGNNSGKGFSEEDEPNFYGQQFYSDTKTDSERILKKLPGLLLRIRMPIDDRPHPRNLIDKLVSFAKVIDIQNSMATVPHMIPAIKSLIERRREGVYHLTNPGTISAREIMEMYGEIVDQSHNFGVMDLEELGRITKAKRSNCVLSSDKLRAEGIELPEIHDAVRICLEKYKVANRI